MYRCIVTSLYVYIYIHMFLLLLISRATVNQMTKRERAASTLEKSHFEVNKTNI